MAKRARPVIQLATGPYNVKKETAPGLAERIKFRHYKPEELELGRDFIRQGHVLGKYYFDVYLSTAESEVMLQRFPTWPPQRVVPWMLRIDAVCYRPETTIIIEIKNRLLPSGIGELVSYRPLFEKQYPVKGDLALFYVARHDHPSLDPALKDMHIRKIIIPFEKAV